MAISSVISLLIKAGRVEVDRRRDFVFGAAQQTAANLEYDGALRERATIAFMI